MQKYTATLTRDIVENIRFESVNLYGEKLQGADNEYTVQHPVKAGPKGFKRLRDAKAWVARVNTEHGTGTAIIGYAA